MNEQLAIYLWSISEGVKDFLVTIPLITLFVYMVIAPIIADFEWSKMKPCVIILVIATIISIVVSGLIPSKQDLALIFLYPKVKQGTINMVQSNTAKKMQIVLDSYLDKQIKELQKND